ncbi:hypothetical protein KI387_010703 [Taxus chinensis]|uniref:Protein kinase domain-containing protein n=1 Tax=Taxus chinensis TaxID=29808 RepID=A0AA38FM58_TAXCH|nr:hypothetical protein KI387_010703 [Taxus chinensis]
MSVIDKNMWIDICDQSSSNGTAQFWSGRQFHIVDGYRNITLFGHCGSVENADYLSNNASKLDCTDAWYYPSLNSSLTWSKEHCKSKIHLPFQRDYKLPRTTNVAEILKGGFEIKWSFSKDCESCGSRNSTCKYNNISTQPFCDRESVGYGGSGKSKLKTTIVVVVVSIVGSALLISAVFNVIAYRKRLIFFKQQDVIRKEHDRVEIFLHNYIHEMPARYSYSQLKNITDNFAHKLGEGGFGVVYKGKLQSGNVVAVKVLDQSRQSETQFMNEVATIGRIHHIHLVRLLGFCFEQFTSALVYEYMANGSLDSFIFGKRQTDKKRILNWDQLYSIALGAARGIVYLHD